MKKTIFFTLSMVTCSMSFTGSNDFINSMNGLPTLTKEELSSLKELYQKLKEAKDSSKSSAALTSKNNQICLQVTTETDCIEKCITYQRASELIVDFFKKANTNSNVEETFKDVQQFIRGALIIMSNKQYFEEVILPEIGQTLTESFKLTAQSSIGIEKEQTGYNFTAKTPWGDISKSI